MLLWIAWPILIYFFPKSRAGFQQGCSRKLLQLFSFFSTSSILASSFYYSDSCSPGFPLAYRFQNSSGDLKPWSWNWLFRRHTASVRAFVCLPLSHTLQFIRHLFISELSVLFRSKRLWGGDNIHKFIIKWSLWKCVKKTSEDLPKETDEQLTLTKHCKLLFLKKPRWSLICVLI